MSYHLVSNGVVASLLIAANGVAGPQGEAPTASLPLLDQVFVGAPTSQGGELGRSVAFREPFLVSGAWTASSPGMPLHGAARTWRYSPDGWLDEGLLLAQDRAAGDRFGCAVAVARSQGFTGPYVAAVIGAEGADTNGLPDTGAVYVFRRQGGGEPSWTQVARLVASQPQASAKFGRAVAIDRDLIAVGAPQEGSFRGGVHLFRLALVDGANVWQEEAILTADDAAVGDELGSSVDVVGNLVVAGAWGKSEGMETHLGALYVFERGESGWQQVAKLTAPDAQARDEFGRTVAIDREGLVIAAGTSPSLSTGLAKVHVFERGDEGWAHAAVLLPPSPQVNDGFASAIAVDDDRILVGAPSRTVNETTLRGAAYLYARGVEGTWTLDVVLADDEGRAGDALGSAVALHGEAAVVGARGVDLPPIPNVGATFLFWSRDCDGSGTLNLCNPSPADFNVDGFVDGIDLAMVLCNWGATADQAPGDADGNGIVDGNDLAILLGQWTGCP